MNNKKYLSVAVSSLLLLSACGGSSAIQNLVTPDDIGVPSKIDTAKFFFASDEKVFPSSECNSELFKLLSDASDFKQTHLVIEAGKSTNVHQQVLSFGSDSEAKEVLDAVKNLVSGECNEKNSLFSEFIYEPIPTSGFGDGVTGLTWINSGSQSVALSCEGPNALYFESQKWVVVKANQVLITSVSELTCGDDDLPLGEEERAVIGEKAIKVALQ